MKSNAWPKPARAWRKMRKKKNTKKIMGRIMKASGAIVSKMPLSSTCATSTFASLSFSTPKLLKVSERLDSVSFRDWAVSPLLYETLSVWSATSIFWTVSSLISFASWVKETVLGASKGFANSEKSTAKPSRIKTTRIMFFEKFFITSSIVAEREESSREKK